MYTVLVIVHVLVAAGLIGLVLIQHGKGADAGAAFGSGASGTVFGSRGSANFLTKTTAWLAAAFFAVSLALAYLVHGRSGGSIVDQLPAAAPVVAPAAPSAPPATAPVVVPDAAPSGEKPAAKQPEVPAPKVPD